MKLPKGNAMRERALDNDSKNRMEWNGMNECVKEDMAKIFASNEKNQI